MSGIDVAIIMAFIAYALWEGISARAAAGKNLEEYFLAGRTLPGWKAGLSMSATQFAADTPLLVTGLIATAGIFSLWRMWIYAIAFLVLGFILAPSWRRAGVITDAELTEVRYGGKAAAVLRGVKAIYFGTIFNCAVLSFVLLAATRIAEPFLTWDQWGWFPDSIHGAFVAVAKWIGTPITIVPADAPLTDEVWIRSANNLLSIVSILFVTTFYSTTGGLRSVVNTDIVQLFIMLVATAAFTWFVVDRVGGFGALSDQIHARFADGDAGGITSDQILAVTPSRAKDAGVALLAVFVLQWLAQMNADGTGYLAQRSMACRSDEDARRAAVWFTVTQVLLRSLMWVPLGLGLLLMYPIESFGASAAEREYTFVRGMAELPAGLKGLLVTAMLAALASTVDTHLNWGASYWTNDIYKRFICQSWLKKEPSDRSLVWVARGANIGILLISLVVMTQLTSIASAWKVSLLLGAGMGGVLILRWVWWRLTAWGELSAIIASAVLAPILLHLIDADTPDDEALRLLLMFAGSTSTGIGVSLASRRNDMPGLVAFYQRTRPPGMWGPVAREAGGDPAADLARLGIGALTVAVAAMSVFSMLTAAVSLIASSPEPTWFPLSRTVWIVVVAAVGIGLIPVWRSLMRRPTR